MAIGEGNSVAPPRSQPRGPSAWVSAGRQSDGMAGVTTCIPAVAPLPGDTFISDACCSSVMCDTSMLTRVLVGREVLSQGHWLIWLLCAAGAAFASAGVARPTLTAAAAAVLSMRCFTAAPSDGRTDLREEGRAR